MTRFISFTRLYPTMARGQTCRLTLSILTGADHGALDAGRALSAQVTDAPRRRLRMCSKATAYLTDGGVQVSGPGGTGLIGRPGVIHVIRAPNWAD
ncbi:hypothetical protein [Roseobacter sinensis]|uniref:Uncharacterized protein n=1 Tax=Roseobacter sinensis TaxID=2931391 RepID=A0ABT3BIR4_9RHOB|nr:hypothetical protein [Roseobacter sp. WL0113]MCV3273465.1 hypothetical protein [Roseobacter sp. WL0113]